MKKTAILLVIIASPAFPTTITNSYIDGIGTTSVIGRAEAEYIGCWQGCPPGYISASSTASLMTLGDQRPGHIILSINGGGEFGTGSGAVGQYSFWCGDLCWGIDSAPRPFELGTEFDIKAAAAASSFNGGSGLINFRFTIFDEDWRPVEVYSCAVPEPAGWGLLLIGVLFLLLKSNVDDLKTKHLT